MRLPRGQPLWQNGTPHSMHRAPCSASSRSLRWSTNSLKSCTRSLGSRSGTPTRWIFKKAPSSPIEGHLLGAEEPLATGGHRAPRGLVLLALELLEHAAVVLGEDLDELRHEIVEALEHPPADGRGGALDVLGDQVAHLDGVGLVPRREVLDERGGDLGAGRAV